MLLLMKYMGIDYGTKKVGIAVSNEDGTMAFPREVVPNDEKLLAALVTFIEKEHIEAIVIGHSLDRTGAPNKVQSAVEELIGDLTLEVGVPIHLEPEQYTTQAALRLQGRNDKTDASAAALILDSYLMRVK